MADRPKQRRAIERSGLFDADFYIRFNGLSRAPPDDPLLHYCDAGEDLGYRPNFLFDPAWYRKTLAAPGAQGLLAHYATEGEPAGLAPSILFDPTWYRRRYGAEAPLSHYLRGRRSGTVSPNPYFDTAWYIANNADLSALAVDAFEHFVRQGLFEGRHPSPQFDPDYVWRRYLNRDRTKNAYLLFLQFHDELGWTGTPPAGEPSVAREIARATSPGPAFEELPAVASGLRRAKALAFYLPQFHAIPENDRWWGAGFTEWRNVPRGVPRFAGHDQPRVPRDLGYYELLGTAVLKRQVDLARQAGLFGFCFYYYNFNGHRLLERPLDGYLADPEITFPFCLMWANENWTRHWDGLENDVLIGQDYRSDEAPALIADLARYIKDPRYVRIAGRPVVFIYRADVIPDTPRTLQRWRRLFAREHGLEPLLVMAQTFGNIDPRPFGFDAAVEFPPHKFGSFVPPINGALEVFEPGYAGDVRSYDDVVAASLADQPVDYPLIKTVIPSWDNEARKPGSGLVIHGSTPAKFQAWIEALVAGANTAPVFGERLLCVNAWNEWCEGAYLEPDVHHGFAYLNAFARGLSTVERGQSRKLVLVGHDAHPAGAQQLLLNIGQTLRFRFGVQIAFVLMGSGALAAKYAEVAPTHVVDRRTEFWTPLIAHLHGLRASGFRAAVINSALSGSIVAALADLGFATCSLVHELPTLLAKNGGEDHLGVLFARSDHVVFPAASVRDDLVARFGPPRDASSVQPQGLYKDLGDRDAHATQRVRAELGLRPGDRLVVNAGFADLRKGVDLFVAIARCVALRTDDVVFAWIGDAEASVDAWLLDAVRADPRSNIRLVPFTEAIGPYLHAAELFLLTSREDPFPSVVLEALSVGLPVAALRSSGGFIDLLADPQLGILLPQDDPAATAEGILAHLAEPGSNASAEARRRYVADHHDFGSYCFAVMRRAIPTPTISVVVPNYNYKPYLEARLASVLNQTHPVFELIVLDDASTDGSVAEIERVAALFRRDLVLIENPENAGHVASQWRRGVERATGDLVWIAEADDLAEPGFLDGLALFFDRPGTAFAFADSSLIDGDGVALGSSYKSYYDTVFPGALAASALFEGADFRDRFLSVKNVVLNASAVLWRRDILAAALDACSGDLVDLSVAADWLLYLQACQMGRVGYNAQPLNIHRRHPASLTHAMAASRHVREVAFVHNHVQPGGADLTTRQARYREELEVQFGLRPGAAPVQPSQVRLDAVLAGAAAPPRSRA